MLVAEVVVVILDNLVLLEELAAAVLVGLE
jgi:hypothetical protein